MKRISKIICLIMVLVLMCTVMVAAAGINYEAAVEQALSAAKNATASGDKVFYLVTAIYDYCYTFDPSRAAPLLDEIKAVIESDPDNLEANSAMAANITSSACELLIEKQEYETARAMGEATLDFYGNYDADTEAISDCKDNLAKCDRGVMVDMLMLIAIPVFVLAVIIIVAVVNKRTKK